MDSNCCSATKCHSGTTEAPDSPSPFDREVAGLAKALAHPSRVQIVRYLLTRDCCMCGDIVDHLPLAQSTVSQHLRVLKDAGLLRGGIDGPRVCYCVDPPRLQRIRELISQLSVPHPEPILETPEGVVREQGA